MYWAIFGCTGLHCCVLDCNGLKWAVLGCTGVVCNGLYRAVFGFTGMYVVRLVRVFQVGQMVQVVQVVQVIQMIQVVHVVRMISLDDMHSENIWFSWSKPSNYRGKLRCHACDGGQTDGRRKVENSAVF